jgi:stage III sporulation protein AD
MENELVRICGIGIICALGVVLLKGIGSSQALLLRLLGVSVIFGAGVFAAYDILQKTTGAVDLSALGEYTVRMTKTLGLAMLTGFSADICRDCGENTVAAGVETVGNVCILSLCIPLFSELIGYAQALLEAV